MKIFAGFYGIQFCLVKIRSEFVNYKEMPGSYFSPPTRPPRLSGSRPARLALLAWRAWWRAGFTEKLFPFLALLDYMIILEDIGLHFKNIKGFYFLLILLTLPVILIL
jgi:hypothetical protein